MDYARNSDQNVQYFAANEPGGRNRYTQYCMFFKATDCYSFADVKCNNYHGGYICKNVN